MSIQKKSLISTLKTTKKAKVASTPSDATVKGDKSVRMAAGTGRGVGANRFTGTGAKRNASFARND